MKWYCPIVIIIAMLLCGCSSKSQEKIVTDSKESIQVSNKASDTPIVVIDTTSSQLDDPEVVDLIFFMGQSNMAGYGGDASLAPSVSEEAGEEFRAISDPTRLYKIEEPFGKLEDNPNGIQDKKDAKKGSLVSAFVNEYYKQTGTKVIAVSNAIGGMTIDLWLQEATLQDSSNRIETSIEWLTNNGYTINNKLIVWLQGESDATHGTTPSEYRTMFDEFMSKMIESGIDKVCIITPGNVQGVPGVYDEIIDMQKEICAQYDYCILATDRLSSFDDSYMTDVYHYNQQALNEIGAIAADGIAQAVK